MMRRPPDKSGSSTVSDAGVESSNATLNTLFGGARQKAWMTSAGASVRPSPRRLSKPSLPTMLEQENASTTTVLLSPSPSGGTSPLLYNNDVPHQGSGYGPSPAPTQISATNGLRSPREILGHAMSLPQLCSGGQSRLSPSQASSNQGSPHLQTENVYNPTTANRHHHQARQPQQDNRADPQRIQSPIVISESPVRTHAQIPSQRPDQDRRPVLQGIQSPMEISESPIQTHAQNIPQQSSSVHGGIWSTVPPRPERPQSYSANNYNQTQNPIQNSPISLDTVSGNPPFPHRAGPSRLNGERISSLPLRQPWNSGQPDAPPNSHRHTKTQISQFPLLKPKVALIQSHITSVGGTQNLNNGLERPRFQLLIDACETQDIFYVVLHQIFCTWDYDQSQLLSISGLPTREVLAVSFSILGQLIRNNQGMAPNHLRWFAGFPSPLNFLWATYEAYQQVVADVGAFLTKLALQWTYFSRQCLARNYPPFVDELVNGLGVLSHILQGIIFTATRRNLGLSDELFGPWTEKLFNEDKRHYQEISVRYKTPNPPSEVEMRQHNQALAAKYCALANMRPQARDGSEGVGSSPAHLPTETSNAQLSQLNANQPVMRPLRNIDQVPRNQNSQIRDPRAKQHPQPLAAMTAELSTTPPVTIAQHPPRPASQQPNAEASSPTSLENSGILPPIVPAEILPSPATASQGFPSQGHPGLRRPTILGSNNTQAQPIPSHSVTGQSRMTTSDLEFNIGPQYTSELQRVEQHHQQNQSPMLQQHSPIPLDQRHMPDAPNAHIRQRRFPSEMQHPAAPQNYPGHMIRDAPPRGSTRPRSQLQNGAGDRVTGAVVAPPQPRVSSLRHRQLPEQSKIQVYNGILPPIMRPLLPPLGYTRPNEAPNPGLTALHQAQVQSPILAPAYILDGKKPDGGQKQPKFFQCIKEFALEPSVIRPITSISKFTFVVNETALSLKAKDKPGDNPRHVARGYERGTLQFRLRCVQAKENSTAYEIAEWVLCDTAWPETIFIQVNGKFMEIRRKAHYGKDLPVDITTHILSATPGEGSTNNIRISTPRSTKNNDTRIYFVAVEVVEVLDHPYILDMCHQQHIPASKTVNTIKRVLAGPPLDDDDEITMIVSDLSIDLADPFTARIFDIPVRGSSCLHRECFDLETFLDTRKSKFIAQPSLVDVWKCPLCGADARPYVLRIDDFFVTVRAKLADDDNLDVKAILVSADGSWKPKPEAPLKRKSSNRPDESDDEEEGPAAKQRILDRAAASRAASMEAHQARESANRSTEIIVLDDDDN